MCAPGGPDLEASEGSLFDATNKCDKAQTLEPPVKRIMQADH